MASTEALQAELTQLRFERAALLNAERALSTLLHLRGEAHTLKAAEGIRQLQKATSPRPGRQSTAPALGERSRQVLHEICVL
jgi:hypothetical protein